MKYRHFDTLASHGWYYESDAHYAYARANLGNRLGLSDSPILEALLHRDRFR